MNKCKIRPVSGVGIKAKTQRKYFLLHFYNPGLKGLECTTFARKLFTFLITFLIFSSADTMCLLLAGSLALYQDAVFLRDSR